MTDLRSETLPEALDRLSGQIARLEETLRVVERRPELQILVLRQDLGHLDEKLETRASQSSIDELRSDLKSMKDSIGTILGHMVARSR